jgi:Cof subfamily protein (haloacid dehalogenase superfamily)
MDFQKDRIKAVVIDLDGTVLGADGRLSGRTLAALRACADSGIRVIIATGRSMDAAEPYRAAIGLTGPMVYYNGAMVVDMPRRKPLACRYIGRDIMALCADVSRQEGVHFHVFLCKEDEHLSELLVAEVPSAATVQYKDRTGLDFLFGDLKAIIADETADCVKGIFVGEAPQLQRVRRLLQDRLGGRAALVMSADFILEVLEPSVSKGAGMSAALRFYGLEPKDAIAFGDEENDISMLALAGFSAAVANARQSAQDAAKLVIGANTDDSVAAFLEKHLL